MEGSYTITGLLQTLQGHSVTFRIAQDGRLLVHAPGGVLETSLRAAISEHKAELLTVIALENCETAYRLGNLAESERWANEFERLASGLWESLRIA